MRMTFHIPCPHCRNRIVIPKGDVPLVIVDECEYCHKLYIAIHNKARRLYPSIMRCGDPARIHQHFIDQASDLGAELLEGRFDSNSGNSTRIIRGTDAEVYPSYKLEELDEDGIRGQWDQE